MTRWTTSSPQTSQNPQKTPSPQTSQNPQKTPSPQTSQNPQKTPSPQTSQNPQKTPSPQTSQNPQKTPSPQTSQNPQKTPSSQTSQNSLSIRLATYHFVDALETPRRKRKRPADRKSSTHPSKRLRSVPSLTQEDRDRITSPDGWLSDSVMDAAQALLANQFKEIDSLQSVCLLQAGANQATLGTPEGNWIQIINTGNHWVTVSNINSQPNSVNVYDSMNSLTVIPNHIRLQLQVLTFDTVRDKLVIHIMDTQKQKGGDDCGFFAIAAATSLCFGDDPTTLKYKQNKIRQHLHKCLNNGSLTLPIYPTCEETMASDPNGAYL